MNSDPDIVEALAFVRLPPSYSWGEWNGDYRDIMKGERRICRVGGLMAKISARSMQGEVCRAIMKGEWEWGQTDALMAWSGE